MTETALLKVVPLTKVQLEQRIDEFIELSSDMPHEYWTIENFLMDLPGKWDYSIACYLKKTLLGYIIASKKTSNTIHIHHFVVSKRYRGKGFGYMLLNVFVLMNQGFNITLKVYSDNEKAQNFYFRSGFEEVSIKNSLKILIFKQNR